MKQSFKKIAVFFLQLFFLSFPLFAQTTGQVLPPGMESLATSIRGIFQSEFVKVILAIFLCGSALAYAFNKDNEKIKRNAIAIGLAAAILITAQTIVNQVWSAASGG